VGRDAECASDGGDRLGRGEECVARLERSAIARDPVVPEPAFVLASSAKERHLGELRRDDQVVDREDRRPSERGRAREEVADPRAVRHSIEEQEIVGEEAGRKTRVGVRVDRARDVLGRELLGPMQRAIAMTKAVDTARDEHPHEADLLRTGSEQRQAIPNWRATWRGGRWITLRRVSKGTMSGLEIGRDASTHRRPCPPHAEETNPARPPDR
jgi:hypothetical protein